MENCAEAPASAGSWLCWMWRCGHNQERPVSNSLQAGCSDVTHHCVTSTDTLSTSVVSGLETVPGHLLFAPDAAICGAAELSLFRQWSRRNLFPHLGLYRSRAEMGHFHLAFHSLGTLLNNLATKTRILDSSSLGQFILFITLNPQIPSL